MALATIFVSLPFVVREVAPVLVEVGDEQEQAAATLGASSWQTFWRITLPSIRWGVAYGVILSTARALGEIGAVLVVSSLVAGQTLTLPLLVYQRDSQLGAGDHRRLRRRHRAGRHLPGRAAGHDRPFAQEARRPMRIDINAISKQFGDFTALRGRLAGGPRGLADRAARPQRVRASRRCCGSSPGSRCPTRARC